MPDVLEVRNFAQIEHARIEFGDLTVLVGPQGAGKSLLLQTWKLALDSAEIVSALRAAGISLANVDELLDAYYGEGMSAAWRLKTRVLVNKRPLSLKSLLRAKDAPARVFFVPAHRALLMSEGWPAPFMRLKEDTPTVARLFSQSLYDRFTGKKAGDLFPVERRLKKSVRELIDGAVFHGGRVRLSKAGL
ncbi:MAG TPA: ATP-binding protein, partial [Myxococcaceae bacterium]|nr:ATP-binding protein [Myxococcaceae bacterium]